MKITIEGKLEVEVEESDFDNASEARQIIEAALKEPDLEIIIEDMPFKPVEGSIKVTIE